MKVKASALIYAIIFSIIIFIVTLFVLSSVYDSEVNFIRLKKWERANDNLQSALSLVLNTPFNKKEAGEYKVDLFRDGKDMVTIRKDQWGVWEVYSILDSVGDVGLSKQVLLGYSPRLDYALALVNTDKVLNLAGNAQVKGDIYVPNGTFKYSYIEGRSGAIGNAIEGAIKRPQEFKSVEISKILKRIVDIKETLAKMKLLPVLNDTMTENSFSNKAVVYYSKGPIELTNTKLSGKILIISEQSISVDKRCKLEDIILMAPEIELRDYFKGTVQCFADRKIVVGEHAHLFYPSALVIVQPKTGITASELDVKRKAIIAGEVFVAREGSGNQKPLITIEEEAALYGQIFSDGLAQLQGKIVGSCCIGGLYLKTRSAVYDNTMLDGQIDAKDLGMDYFDLLDNMAKEKVVIKWLN